MLDQHQAGEETLVALCPDIEPDLLHPETLPDASALTLDALRGLAHALASLVAESDGLEDGRHTFALTFDLSDGRIEAVALSPLEDEEEDAEEDADEDEDDLDDDADEEDLGDDGEEDEGSGLSAEDEAFVSEHADRFAAAIARQFDVDEDNLATQVLNLTAEMLSDDEG